jgi:hypothetical protein
MSELTLNETTTTSHTFLTPTKRALAPEDLTQLSFDLARHVDEKQGLVPKLGDDMEDETNIPFVDLSAAMNYAPVNTETPFESRSRYRSIPIDQHLPESVTVEGKDTHAVLPMDVLSVMRRTLSQVFFCF